ncbi:Murein DD-endopeptidase MepM and murein hydrolase activator NlpD, contain LysM domain [Sphingomonas sp. YR710]|uniref:M23 family metallopeptidase n=1 Tax=Sphingomonas sp. YR710 TaxID=1882773 RepID=UPI00088500BD|nr:M23 family metallopeptidase [Sphingomonas sp. YR710]SDD23014.1 Murein DD-endopeptidase MepM and murein hydrolase activator NlpD, contain LysM domain [Sphingomonas sp. YR710]
MIFRRRLIGAAMTLIVSGCAPTIVPQGVAPQLAPPTGSVTSVQPAAVGYDFTLRGNLEQGGLAIGTAPAGWALRLDGRPIGVATDGRFVIAFDRDAGASAMLEAEADGRLYQQKLTISPRAWQIESLPTLPKGTTPTPEFLARRAEELRQITAARAIDSHSEGWRQHFIWPVQGRISGVFGSQRIYAGEPGAYHPGVDVARPAGTPVVSPADGVVILAAGAPFTLEGNLLMIDHGMGLNSAFLHLSRIDVKVGDVVRQGQPVGAIGMTGRATGPHLHWAMKWRDVRLDPAPVAGPMSAQ